ncbi:Nicotinamide-nucleotide amidohydrolase PncC [Thalassovita gelatinovora]|uniref:Nicotinamide-nucleotide amidohydrolase PncC n=1 Tax=Thalassovita gelatinovora TaxID=53501 RepID=A0A0P1F461_THAGE|nr:CinA family protein [Thalassovita gelatinovora]QIZ79311.1 CinA family protein [Thalassovita gelatinovora]CUH62550.1 Nicotinamide-nucleotide amidohydrolase PncC [Thalassovita gelatinovora]SEQ06373.1 nicotinamide-nucleotide amidase [Thalassovita gelatinovora]
MNATSDVLDRYRTLGLHIATAESCTGGLVMAALTDVPGSSDVVDRGFVTYTNAAKVQMLGVAQTTLDTYGAVSEQVAQEMAEGALARSDADVAVAITGIAGPGGSEFKPEGRVCFGIAIKDHATATETIEFGPLGRANVRAQSVQKSLDLLLNAADI